MAAWICNRFIKSGKKHLQNLIKLTQLHKMRRLHTLITEFNTQEKRESLWTKPSGFHYLLGPLVIKSKPEIQSQAIQPRYNEVFSFYRTLPP